MGRRRHRALAFVVLIALGAAPAGCRRVAEKVAEKGAAAVKDTTKGLEEGLEKGRKQGASADDAIIVAGPADLKGVGSLTIGEVRRGRDGGVTEIVLVVDNTSSRPLRITGLDIFAQDGKGFVKRPVAAPGELTVPPRAKDKLVVAFDSGSDKLVKARIWGVDHELPPPTSR